MIIKKNNKNKIDNTTLCNSLLLFFVGTHFSQSICGIQSADTKDININTQIFINIPRI